MKNWIIVFFACSFLIISSAIAHETWDVSKLSSEKIKATEFLSHEKDNYLAMNLNFEILKPYFELVDNYSYRPLKNRGEAHITVITPVEYNKDLKNYVSMKEIDDIARTEKIQDADIKIVCLGRGRLNQNDKVLDTYYVVIQSQKLLEIRRKIQALAKERGALGFDAEKYSPHITLGFTDRDLHFEDGITKDQKSCLVELHISSLKPSYKSLSSIPNTHLLDHHGKGEIIRGNAPLNYKNLKLMKDLGISEVYVFKNDKAGEVASEINGLHDIGYTSETAVHVDFDWKDNNEFKRGCVKYISTIETLREKMNNNKKVYLHCTTGEDRTGVVSGLYQAIYMPKLSVENIFKNQMCKRGYEAGDKTKDAEVVQKIRAGLTVNFTKMFYLVKQKQKKHEKIDLSLCEKDPETEKDYQQFVKSHKFICSAK